MIVISHRGYWLDESEKNTQTAFKRSFDRGFGTETDVRDRAGRLVISHDMPTGSELMLESFLSTAAVTHPLLAINIKSDGLADLLGEGMRGYDRDNWFAFDMSVPDMRAHLQAGNPVFARMSEVEREPAWYSRVDGIWLDSFEQTWFDHALIEHLLDQGKRVCVVSSELHGRDPAALWRMLLPLADSGRLILCTDWPERAQAFFKEQDA